MEKTEVMKGVLEKVRFASEDGEFTVSDVEVPGMGSVTVVGNLMGTRPGEHVLIEGTWKDNRKFGRQFAIQAIQSVAPTTKEGIKRYLASGLIDGIGDVLAERIVDKFGEFTLEVIDENPRRIREVDGIGPKRAAGIEAAWGEQRLIRNVMVFLQSHGVTPAYATRIWKKYENRAIEVIHSNPYRLADDIFGIGFKSADSIAKSLGVSKTAPSRIQAGLLHTLKAALSDGHVYLPTDVLLARSAEVLDIDEGQITSEIEALRQKKQVVIEADDDQSIVYHTSVWMMETDASTRLLALLETPHRFQVRSVLHKIDAIETEMAIQLAQGQREAVSCAFENKIAVITGGPGTGKTTIIRAIVNLAAELGRKVALAAPTGRAAKRLSEATGRNAMTVHRLLDFNPNEGGFQYNLEKHLDVDLLIIDEASMVDINLLKAIVDALPLDAGLLFVGDIDQLPSVGPGNVLGDIISSARVMVVRLNEIFRQAEESAIVQNAHRINHGELPIDPKREGLVDFYTIATDDPNVAAQKIEELVTKRIPNAFGLDPLKDVQVLAPMRRGVVGTEALNKRLQRAFDQGGRFHVRGATTWREGDKVMQIRNNYEKLVFNGDIGTIYRIEPFQKRLQVQIDDKLIPYEFGELDELRHAFAITVHKSQGSEYPAIVVPVLTQHYMMLQRNLLYTAITRAKQLVILVGSKKAMQIAVKNNESRLRYTRLAERLARA